MKLLGVFGIDLKILLAQFINFGLLVFILYKIGYKPILQFIQKRTSEIEQGVQNAQEAKTILANTQAECDRLLMDAQKKSQDLIQTAIAEAKQQADAVLEKQQVQLEQLRQRTEKELAAKQQRLLDDAKQQIAALTIQASEQLLHETVDASKSQAIVDRLLTESSHQTIS